VYEYVADDDDDLPVLKQPFILEPGDHPPDWKLYNAAQLRPFLSVATIVYSAG
jgi:hypothetical protein